MQQQKTPRQVPFQEIQFAPKPKFNSLLDRRSPWPAAPVGNFNLCFQTYIARRLFDDHVASHIPGIMQTVVFAEMETKLTSYSHKELGATGLDDSYLLTACDMALRLRESLMNQLFGSGPVGNFSDYVDSEFGSAQPHFRDSLLTFLTSPNDLIEIVETMKTHGATYSSPMHEAKLAGCWTKVWSQRDMSDPVLEGEWVMKAAESLHGCSNLLAWSDFYVLCEQYMRRRGNGRMVDKAIDAQKKLLLAALRQEANIATLTERQEALEDAPLSRGLGGKPNHYEEIRGLILAEPPPLQRVRPMV